MKNTFQCCLCQQNKTKNQLTTVATVGLTDTGELKVHVCLDLRECTSVKARELIEKYGLKPDFLDADIWELVSDRVYFNALLRRLPELPNSKLDEICTILKFSPKKAREFLMALDHYGHSVEIRNRFASLQDVG